MTILDRTCLVAVSILLLGFLGGCGDRDCKTKIPEGATYRVDVLEETQDSNACHVVPLSIGSEFELVAGPGFDTSAGECSSSAGTVPPVVERVDLMRCRPAPGGYLGVACFFQYSEAMCEGNVEFFLTDITEAELVTYATHQAVYEVGDLPGAACPPNTVPRTRGCIDRYRVNVQRIHP